MADSGPLTLFGGKRYCWGRKFTVSKVFAGGSVERENMSGSGAPNLVLVERGVVRVESLWCQKKIEGLRCKRDCDRVGAPNLV